MQTLLSFNPLPALVAFGVALAGALLLVLTQCWHGRHTMDSHEGIQK
ncbi:MAG: UDP-N-acetylmuramyl pentapeptide phosphotransferase/UDP-N-acetylglucosamine-phosphate transferase, partial [Polaromonas sp.]|nr:UDP-N-acetylmuramyl pentapeptide phosphotransferase/UDP-N-acetylglucosamine-phosphate transferase [Polaromonas sp.]